MHIAAFEVMPNHYSVWCADCGRKLPLALVAGLTASELRPMRCPQCGAHTEVAQ